MAKTTKRHFKLFRDEVERRVEQFGLKEWRLDFVHINCGDAYAAINAGGVNKVVTLCLNTDWGDGAANPLTDKAIIQRAKHETCELLVSDLVQMARARYVQEDEVDTTKETLVRRLEKLIK